jgi:hypothetical protein
VAPLLPALGDVIAAGELPRPLRAQAAAILTVILHHSARARGALALPTGDGLRGSG